MGHLATLSSEAPKPEACLEVRGAKKTLYEGAMLTVGAWHRQVWKPVSKKLDPNTLTAELATLPASYL